MLKFSDRYPSKLLCTAHVYQTKCIAGFNSSGTEAQVEPYIIKCRNWESTEQVLASAGKHLGALVNLTLQQYALVSRPREKASSTLCEAPHGALYLSPSNRRQKLASLL